jgi:hypothetical protein
MVIKYRLAFVKPESGGKNPTKSRMMEFNHGNLFLVWSKRRILVI